MITRKYTKLKELEKKLEQYIKSIINRNINNNKNKKMVFLVNFPLYKDFKESIDPKRKGSFGLFSKYTIELACKLIKMLKENKRYAKIAFVIDDHAQMEINDWYLSDYKGFETVEKIKLNIDNYFKDFKIPKEIQKIFKKYNLDKKDILSSVTFNTPYFQESKFREKYEKINPTKFIGCADEVELIYKDLAKQGINQLLFFIPHRCKSVTCSAVQRYNKEAKQKKELTKIDKTHIYLSSDRENNKGTLIDTKEKLEKQTNKILGGATIIKFY